MKKYLAIVVAMLIIMTFGLTVSVSAEPAYNAGISTEFQSFIEHEGCLVGISYNEYHEHIRFVEVRNWTFIMKDSNIIWAVPSTGGAFVPTQNVIRFVDYVWDFSPYLNSEDNVNYEMENLFWSQWWVEPESEAK